eukprot:6807480-Pyramimonas_sp.AAC.1
MDSDAYAASEGHPDLALEFVDHELSRQIAGRYPTPDGCSSVYRPDGAELAVRVAAPLAVH